MRILAFSLPAIIGALAMAAPAEAQWRQGGNSYQRELRQVQRECNRDLRRADNRREYRQAQRECQRDIAQLQRRYNGGYYNDGRGWSDDDRYARYERRSNGRRDRDDDDDDD